MAPWLFPVALKGPEEEVSGIKLEREGGWKGIGICSTAGVRWENAQESAVETIPNNKQNSKWKKDSQQRRRNKLEKCTGAVQRERWATSEAPPRGDVQVERPLKFWDREISRHKDVKSPRQTNTGM